MSRQLELASQRKSRTRWSYSAAARAGVVCAEIR